MRVKVDRGFSLAEVMVAFMLLSVISLILSGLIPATITGMARAAQRTTAGFLAENKIAVLRESGFGSIQSSATPHETKTVDGIDFLIKVEVSEAPLSTGGNMDADVAKSIAVLVTWTYRNLDYQLGRRAVVFKRI